MKRSGHAAIVLLLLSGGARAAVISERPDKVAVTIYHEGTVDTASLSQGDRDLAAGIALITETRIIDLPIGSSEIQFRGVAGTMVPQTANVGGLPNGVSEHNFDYDLLSPGALIAKSLGEHVTLVRIGKHNGSATEQDAILRSGPDGTMLDLGGKFEALKCSGLPEKIVFSRVPKGLTDTPTLTVRTNATKAGRYTLTLRYIATGLNWSADYVARIAPDDRTLDLTGWITLANFSDTGFANAPVDVIAGHVETSGEDQRPSVAPTRRLDACWPVNINWASFPADLYRVLAAARPAPPPPPMASIETITVSSSRAIAARDLGDYKQYPLPEPTSVAARQTKQVQFLDQTAVPFSRVYGYRLSSAPGDEENRLLPAVITLRLANTKQGGLGKPLPAGNIVITAMADGEAYMAGRNHIADTAVGLPLEIGAGQTTAVWARVQVVDHTIIGEGNGKHQRGTLEVTIGNDRTDKVAFEWRQAMDTEGIRLISESRQHRDRHGDPMWNLNLKPGERVVLRYTLDVPG